VAAGSSNGWHDAHRCQPPSSQRTTGILRGEATPFYLYDLDAQNRIRRLVPKAKLVVLLRNPVDRAHSNWTHLWAAGLEPERDFVRACALEDERRLAGWAHFWHYVAQGRYGEQLEQLFGLFPREQVLLLLRYRDLRDSPVATLDRVCEFLGVETGLLDVIPAENVTPFVADTRVNAALRAVLRTGGQIGAHFPVPVREAVRRPLLSALRRERGGRPTLSPEQRRAVLPCFAADIARLEQITGLSYADWLTVGLEPDIID
jgi:hypothetical protein